MALPRIVIALIIAFTVSKPIELRLFKGRIEKQLTVTQEEADKQFDNEERGRTDSLSRQLANINSQEENDKSKLFANNPLYTDTKNKIEKLENGISTKTTQVETNKDIINKNQYKETRYRTITNPQTGETSYESYFVWLDNATARAKREENKTLNKEIIDSKTELDTTKKKLGEIESSLITQSTDISAKYQTAKENIQQQLEDLKNSYNTRKRVWIAANKQSVDLPARLEALGNISHFSFNPANENFLGNTIWWASLMITLLFIALETAPVVVKLLTSRGCYDEILERIEHENMVKQNTIKSEINSEINELLSQISEFSKLKTEVKFKTEKDKADVELANNKIILDKIAEYQQELALETLEKWYKAEKANINLDNITSNTI